MVEDHGVRSVEALPVQRSSGDPGPPRTSAVWNSWKFPDRTDVELVNEKHGTRYTLFAKAGGVLSYQQIRRSRRRLCGRGWATCDCGAGPAGERGGRYRVELLRSGRGSGDGIHNGAWRIRLRERR